MDKYHIITDVKEGSIADELEICKGDKLLSVNEKPIEDIFDYRFLTEDEYVELAIEDKNGEVCVYEIEKEYGQDIGLIFGSSLMDEYRSCSNNCIFCFVDQMPPGMRETLYFKDDDLRLSFLQGNYVTLTNMSEHDIQRIIEYRMEPINISIHTTNKELRIKMLHNKTAGEVLKYIDKLYDAKIKMNAQIVLCKGVNDNEELEKTIEDLIKYIPIMESVSVVPVGLTRYRKGLYPLEAFNKEDALHTIDIIEKWQEKLYNEHGIHFIHASDELYLLADLDLPEEERYDGYLQLENGVGMLRSFYNELKETVDNFVERQLSDKKNDYVLPEKRNISLATGLLAAPIIESLSEYAVNELSKNGLIDKNKWDIKILRIINEFFGEHITVSGLLTGGDIIKQLKGKQIGDELLLPVNMFRAGEEYFLDDVTKKDVEEALGVNVSISPASGEAFLNSILGIENTDYRRQHYEQESGGDSRET